MRRRQDDGIRPTPWLPNEKPQDYYQRVAAKCEAMVGERTPEQEAELARREQARVERQDAQRHQESTRDRAFYDRRKDESDDLEEQNQLRLGNMWMRHDPGQPWWPEWLGQHQHKYPDLVPRRLPRELGVVALSMGIETFEERRREGRKMQDPVAFIVRVAMAVQRGEKGRWAGWEDQKNRPDLVVGRRPRRRRVVDEWAEEPEPVKIREERQSPDVKRITSNYPEWREPGED